MTTKQKVINLAKRLNADLDIGGSFAESNLDISCDAPDGFCWSVEPFGGLHGLVTSQWGDETSESSMWQDMLERMQAGLQPCKPNCSCVQ